MSKIYTRGGDRGETGLLGGGRIPKASPRIEAVGAVDELNATLGLTLAHLHGSATAQLVASLQPDLFVIGSHLVAPPSGEFDAVLPALPAERPAQMEDWIDELDAALPPLTRFIMPGGSVAGATLHLARTVCQRAERAVTRLAESEPVSDAVVMYLNRLSDLLFSLARSVNHEAGASEVQWLPETSKGTAVAAQPVQRVGPVGAAIHKTRLVGREWVAKDTLAVHLERPASFSFEAGQYVDLTVPIAKRDMLGPVRSLSIASAPDAESIELVFRMRDTAFKHALAEAPLGTELVIEGPLGELGRDLPADNLVLIVGGVGIAPVMSMLRERRGRASTERITLFYSNRDVQDAAYLDELHQKATEASTFRVIPTMTKPSSEWAGETGRIDHAMLERHLSSLHDATYVLVGSPHFIANLRAVLVRAGVPGSGVRIEMYTGY